MALLQLTVQSTPSFATSFNTVAVREPVPFVATESVAGLTAILIGAIAIVALADLVGSATDAAVTITFPPVGTLGGAAYVVLTPLAVCEAVNEPQELEPHATCQVTPPPLVSLLTTAVSEVLAFTARLEGAGGANSTETG